MLVTLASASPSALEEDRDCVLPALAAAAVAVVGTGPLGWYGG